MDSVFAFGSGIGDGPDSSPLGALLLTVGPGRPILPSNLKSGGLVSDKEDRNRRDYDELKAKLGLKAEKKPASVSDKTPPGGFDLGLERGASELEEQPAVDAIKGVVAGDEAVVRSGGSRFLTLLLVLVGMAQAGAVG